MDARYARPEVAGPRCHATAFTFDVRDGRCLAWYHPPTAPWNDLTLVLCPPIGYESVTSRSTFVQLARALAQRGFPVLAFDYLGTGDSSGDEQRPDRVADWQASIDAAVGVARSIGGTGRVGLLGARLGGTLALDAAKRLGGVDVLVLWGALPDGRSFVRELIATNRGGLAGQIHSMGYVYTASTLDALSELQPMGDRRSPADRILAIERDDLPGYGAPLLQTLRGTAASVDGMTIGGFAGMLRGGTQGALDEAALAAICAWLAISAGPPRPGPAPIRSRLPAVVWTCAGCRETALRLGTACLCGVLTEPVAPESGLDLPTVVLLNDGENYHVGSHRLYVTLARQIARTGFRVLRVDFAGTGDSPPSPESRPNTLYAKSSVRETRTLLDALDCAGHRSFFLMGLCSGAFLAFQTALRDHRVTGLALLNPRLLDWDDGSIADWQQADELHVRTMRAYVHALARPDNWRRLIRGEWGVVSTAHRVRALAAEALHQFAWAMGRGHPTLRATVEDLCGQGTDVLMVAGEDDPSLGYLERHFGRDGRQMRGFSLFSLARVKDGDHTFSLPGNVEAVAANVVQFLGRARHRRAWHERRQARSTPTHPHPQV